MFVGAPVVAGVAFVFAPAMGDQPVGVAVLDGVGEVAQEVAERGHGVRGEVVGQRQADVGIPGFHCGPDRLRAEFVDGVLHVLGVDGARLGDGGGGQGVVGDAVDAPRQSAGGLEQGLDGGRLEQGQFGAGEAQAVGEVAADLVAAEAADVVADDEALAERLVDGHGQPAAQFGEADEEHAQAALGVHAEVGEQAEVLEHVVAQVLGLVDDEDRELLGLLDEAGDLVADGAVGGGAGALLGQAEFPAMDLYMSRTLPVVSET